VKVEEFIVGWGVGPPEIARMDDDAQRRGDGQRYRADNRVRDVDDSIWNGPTPMACLGFTLISRGGSIS